MKLLDRIENPSDLRKLPAESLVDLSRELREFIIDVVAAKEGHLGASLGVVELTLALHYVFNTPEDRLIWDVGHQAYGHKILTGRRKDFHTNRQLGGISGFPKRSESPYDAFGTGHASTSISAILGMALAARLQGKTARQHIAVIGDASIAGGMAFEALNHLGVSDTNVLIILNDNTIGIDPSVGALKEYLSGSKDIGNGQGNLFEDLNLYYEGPQDGHDLPGLINTLQKLSERKGPKLLHITTTKGKGLRQAEENQVVYHAPGKFDKHTGELLPKHAEPGMGPKYQDVFGHTLVTLAALNPDIVGITPAMPTGSSLKYLMEAFPDRAFDVGIAEQHAVTLAAGLAAEGLIPYCAIYSTFLQRAYDQLIHDVALQELRVVFCLDRAGLVGRDGPTHHGIFDIAYLRCIPNMTLMAPMDNRELRNMLYSVQAEDFGTVAIRYPRGASQNPDWEQPFEAIPKGRGRKLKAGNRIAVLSLGPWGQDIAKILPDTKDPDAFGHYDMRFVKPLDADLLREIAADYEQIVTLEDGCKAGGFGSAVLEFLNSIGYKGNTTILGLEDSFPPHGATSELRHLQNLTPDNIQTTLNQLI
ncbi:1-deoxy-D-xylulose-5-phosphate synthase [Robiginitalea myxolifaciens]|uniref:1-deoxy-D-xylulose-5-phosphate synthase n=1 Tax=Robiginitalea myxolifaciens TaxID=400055 RepID=A0A1I6FZ11_9FLAO|nr:1-deoxy-D-xylulose-5-phosphate synthase [Robiginitalea myxolifaciens]SFR35172.1 1-deoxy-D-xylulose-5-phosphate synthase [Robiginitalea myxolifaciens]